MGGEPLIRLSRVSFSYPLPGGGARPALHDVDVAVRAGESVVVLGAGGAGKSTLAALLAGVAHPWSGAIARTGAGPPGAPPVLPVGLVTENPEDCFSSPVVREEMGVVLDNLGRDPARIGPAVDAALAEIGLAGHADARPATLSGGQKQLLAIASVLIAEPPLLVLDEPLTLLDAPGRADVERLLERRAARGATVYLTSDVSEAARGGRTVVLHRGRVVWQGASTDLPRDARTLGSWDLLPSQPVISSGGATEGTVMAEGWREAGAPGARPAETEINVGGGRFHGGSAPSGAAGAAVTPAIAVEDLHFSYDPGTPRERVVLRGVDLEACAGELLGVVGAIGSGKTTLIQHLNGLLPPQRGRVTVGSTTLEPGVKLRRLLHREVGLVFQFPEKQLFAESVERDVAAGPEFAGVPRDRVRLLAREALGRVGLDPDEYGPRPPFNLSWGEKRLVAIAGVLALGTPVLVLDEPGVGLDPLGRRRVLSLLGDLAHREGRAVIVVSHHLDDLFRVADRVAVLHDGKIAFAGPPADLGRSGRLVQWGLASPARPTTPRRPPPRS